MSTQMADARIDPNRADFVVGVVGAGAMGRGIMQVAAEGGLRVIAYDMQPGAAATARTFIVEMLERGVAKRTLTPEAATAAAARITVADTLAGLKVADLVVEAIVERLDAKQALLGELDQLCPPQTILASNTSSLPITAIAAKCQHPERIAGLHFFNPVPLMKLVEVIPGIKTAPEVTEALMVIARRMTREPVRCTDSPGFIVNHIGRAYVPEAARIVAEGIASPATVDRIMTGAAGFKMGPFQLQDLVGADVSVAVMESLLGQFYGEPMYAPQSIQRLRVDGGLYGQKAGGGWYAYAEGRRVEPALPTVPGVMPARIWIKPSPRHPELQAPLAALLVQSGVALDPGREPAAGSAIVLTQIGYDLTTAIIDLKLNPARTVAIDVLFGTDDGGEHRARPRPLTMMVTPATSAAVRDGVHAALAATKLPVFVINDSPGFVAQRIVAHLINVSCQIAQRQIASPADIDRSAKLGLAYPHGPLAWGDQLGPKRVLGILDCLHAFYQEPRYRPSPWLKRRAMLGLSLLTPDGAV
jgi:3-hydroxybutyryl-CoA dehydrogenase